MWVAIFYFRLFILLRTQGKELAICLENEGATMKSNYPNLENEAAVREGSNTSRTLIAILFCLAILSAAGFASPPFNDNFSNPQVFTGVSGQAISTTVEGTLEPFEPPHAFNRGGHSIWFKYVAPGDGVLDLRT